MQIKLYLFQLFFILINSLLLHTRLEKAINMYDLNILSSEIDLQYKKGYDERFPENILENQSILLEIIKNIERLRKIRHLESIQHACDEIKIQAVKDLSDDIRPISITNGGLYNDWLLDQEFES